jgi:Tol biopolymer transport system component
MAHYFMDAETDNLWRIRLVSTGDGNVLGEIEFPESRYRTTYALASERKIHRANFLRRRKHQLLLLSAAGGEPKIVSGLGKGDVNWFDWSRDGRRILLSHTTETQDLVSLSR